MIYVVMVLRTTGKYIDVKVLTDISLKKIFNAWYTQKESKSPLMFYFYFFDSFLKGG